MAAAAAAAARERCRCVRQPVSSPSGVAPPSPGCVPPLPRVARAPALSSATGLAELNRSPPLYLSPMVVGSPPRLAHPTPATSAAWLLRVASTSFLVCPVTFELSLSLPSSLLYNVCARLADSSHRKQVLLLLLPYPDHKNATGSQHSSIRVDRVKSNGLLRVDRVSERTA